jgi:hypothetical protein
LTTTNSPLNKTLLATIPGTSSGASGQTVRVSVFAIIIVGLIAGLIVGLITSPGYTLQGFFIGFAGGSLITVAVYFFSFERSSPAR